MRRSEGLIRASMIFQPCFLAVEMTLRRMARFSLENLLTRETDVLTGVLHALRGSLPAVLAVEVPIQNNWRRAGPGTGGPRPVARAETGRWPFTSIGLHGALEPLAVEQAVLAGLAGVGVVQDGLQDVSRITGCQCTWQDESQAHDPAIRVLSTDKGQRRYG